MRYRVRDLPAVLRTPIGRAKVRDGLWYRAWPVLRRCAGLHRATLARRVRVVVVVGSLGKTTTARAVATALGGKPDPRMARNALSSAARAVLRIRPGARRAVLEISISRQGTAATYARMLRPDIAVVTSIASEHNRSFGTLEVTREEKAEMVRALPASGLAVLNGDDPNVMWMATVARSRVVTFGFGPGCDVTAGDVALEWPHGTRFTLRAAGETRSVRVRLIGRPMVYPVLAAVAVVLAEGVPLDDALGALERLPPTPGRLQAVPLENGAVVLRDEFKSTLETIDAALDVLADVPASRRLVVLGDVSEPPGSQGPIYRRLGGRVAAVAGKAVFVGGSFQRYAAGARRAGMPADALVDAGHSLTLAVEAIRADLRAGDVLLVKGRDTQRLDRVSLALAGRTVRCELRSCDLRAIRCDDCPMLERGWQGRRVPM